MTLAEKNKLEVVPTDNDEPEYEGVTGMKLSLVGQTEIFVCFRIMKPTKVLKAIVCADKGNEILVDPQTLVKWGIIPKCFPLPINANDRIRNLKVTQPVPKEIVDMKQRVGSWRTDIKFNHIFKGTTKSKSTLP